MKEPPVVKVETNSAFKKRGGEKKIAETQFIKNCEFIMIVFLKSQKFMSPLRKF